MSILEKNNKNMGKVPVYQRSGLPSSKEYFEAIPKIEPVLQVQSLTNKNLELVTNVLQTLSESPLGKILINKQVRLGNLTNVSQNNSYFFIQNSQDRELLKTIVHSSQSGVASLTVTNPKIILLNKTDIDNKKPDELIKMLATLLAKFCRDNNINNTQEKDIYLQIHNKAKDRNLKDVTLKLAFPYSN